MADREPCIELLDPKLVKIFRAMSPDRRIEVGLDMTELVRARLSTHLTESLGLEPDQIGPEISRRHRIASG